MSLELIKGLEVETKLKKEGIALLNVYADWCGPCKMFAPVLEEIAKKDDIQILKVDWDQNKSYVESIDVHSVPTTFIYKDGKIVEKFSGFLPKEVLEKKLKEL
jgi:thioredoxin 1